MYLRSLKSQPCYIQSDRFCESHRFFHVRIDEDNTKRFAPGSVRTQTASHVGASRRHQLGRATQYDITEEVAVCVVHFFKLVKVGKNVGDLKPVAEGAGLKV